MQRSFLTIKITSFLFCILFILIFSGVSQAKDLKTIALIPFEVNSPDDISHIKVGVLNMLYSRLSWKNHIKVLEKRITKKNMAQLKGVTGNELIKKISEKTGSEYIISGSITQFANSFSLDARVYDIENKRYLTFFEQSKKIDDIIPKLDRIAAKINKTVFNRTTVSFEEMEKEKKSDIEKWKRQNPENLIPVFQRSQNTDTPVWKVWKYIF